MTNETKLAIGVLVILTILGIQYLILRRLTGTAPPLNSPSLKKSKNILFLGDSLTAFQNSYADQLKSMKPELNIKKVAEVGKQTSWMLSKLPNEQGYDTLVVWGGVNDIYARNNVSVAKQSLSTIFSIAKQNGAKVIAITVPPTGSYPLATSKTKQLTEDLNEWIIANAPQVIIVGDLIGANGVTQPAYLQQDKLHLNAAGHAAIANKLKQFISF